jgi:hypothetical protein
VSKLEHLFRLALLILMFATFWVPTYEDSTTYVPLWNTLLLLAGMAVTGEIEPFFPVFPFMIGLPVLFLLNLWLLLRPSQILRVFYRILLTFVVSVKWYAAVKWGLGWPAATGILAEYMAISVGVLFEVILVLLTLFRKQYQKADSDISPAGDLDQHCS